jgi:CheY-like chemotaxis protein
MGNQARLGQVFLNLLLNAAQAIPEGDAQRHEIAIDLRCSEGGMVLVEIRDTGPGISSDHIDRIFDPFFTTKSVGKGTGLGLTICEGIVQAHHGSISARTEKGIGTVFSVRLPSAADHAAPAALRPVLTAARRGRVLVVDDEPDVARCVTRMLRASHDAFASIGGRDALARLVRGETFDVVLCDLMMPDLTGMDLHAALLTRAPAMASRMVFFTGGAFTPRAEAFLSSIENPCLTKPIDRVALEAVVARMVAAESQDRASPAV